VSRSASPKTRTTEPTPPPTKLSGSSKRLLALVLLGALLVGGALWTRRHYDPDRYRAYPVSRLEAWIAQNPDDADALYELARKYRGQGQVSDARQALERAQRLEPGNARVLNDLGELTAARGDTVTAQRLFEQAVRQRPDLPDAHRNLGDLAGIARNYVLAIGHYRRALQARPDDVQTLTSLGSAYADALNRGEAEAAFRKAIALAPQNPEPQQRLGLALLKLRDFTGARAALQKAVELAPPPGDAHSHLLLGLAYAQQLRTPEDEQQALEHLDKAVALGYPGGEDDYASGLVYLRRKQYGPAIKALEAAVRQDAGGDDARYRLGRAYVAAGQTARGQALLKQFERLRNTEPEVRRLRYQLATRPDDRAARLRLARLCADTGRTKEALQQYRVLTAAGNGDAATYAAMERAAVAVGDTAAAEQARAALRRLGVGSPQSTSPPSVPPSPIPPSSSPPLK
jgi:tetratricopeptide (TPR) repeat protein